MSSWAGFSFACVSRLRSVTGLGSISCTFLGSPTEFSGMPQRKWGRSLSVWKERREAGWMYCGGHTRNRRPAGVRRFCGDVLALWHCLEEVRDRNPGCGYTADCISNPADPRLCPRCLYPTVGKPSSSHKARNLLARNLGIAKLQRRKKISPSPSPFISVCPLICSWNIGGGTGFLP